jgi:hypothetical protein
MLTASSVECITHFLTCFPTKIPWQSEKALAPYVHVADGLVDVVVVPEVRSTQSLSRRFSMSNEIIAIPEVVACAGDRVERWS